MSDALFSVLTVGGYLAVGVGIARAFISYGEEDTTLADAAAYMLAWPIIVGIVALACCVGVLGWIAGGKRVA